MTLDKEEEDEDHFLVIKKISFDKYNVLLEAQADG